MADGNGKSGSMEDVYARAAAAAASRRSGAPQAPAAKPAAKPASKRAEANGAVAGAVNGTEKGAEKGTEQPVIPPPAPEKPAKAPKGAKAASDKPSFLATAKAKLAEVTQRVGGGDDKEAAPPKASAPAPAVAPTVAPVVAPVKPTSSNGATVGTRPVPVVPPAAAAPAKPEEADKHKVGVARRTRKARLRLSRLDPWSVMKTAFMFSIAGGIMLVVGVYAVWTVISGSGLFDNINSVVAAVVSTPGDTTPFRVEDYVNTAKVMGITAFIACIDVVIITALATLGGFLYNLAATMLGGLEITLAED